MYYNRFRYYDCDTGQYLCADPIGLAGGANPYSYVNNPLKYIDSLGLKSGKGAYKDVGGHHVYAKAGFKNTPNYNPNEAFSISYDYMDEREWDHKKMTSYQRKAFKDLHLSGKCNSLKEHTKIAVDALRGAGATKQEARDLVAEALRDLRKNKTITPSNIPWYT